VIDCNNARWKLEIKNKLMSFTSAAQLVTWLPSRQQRGIDWSMSERQLTGGTICILDGRYLTRSTPLTEMWNVVHDISLCLFESINAGKGKESLKALTVCRDALSSVLGSFSICHFISAYLCAAHTSADKSVIVKQFQRSVRFWHPADRASWYILVMKPTRCTNLFWYRNPSWSR
jgi:hypothetical protein